MEKMASYASEVFANLGVDPSAFSSSGRDVRRREPTPAASYQNDDFSSLVAEAAQNRVDLQGIASGQIPGLAPIPVPGYPSPQDIPPVPGVNTIPGLSNFNYVVGQLIPSMIPPTNT